MSLPKKGVTHLKPIEDLAESGYSYDFAEF